MNRYKLRRLLEVELVNLNTTIKNQGHDFEFRTTPHFADDLLDRGITIESIIALITRVLNEKVDEMQSFFDMPFREAHIPEDEAHNYRPPRLEMTDGNLWIGTTSGAGRQGQKDYKVLICRMAIINPKRHPSKVAHQLIRL